MRTFVFTSVAVAAAVVMACGGTDTSQVGGGDACSHYWDTLTSYAQKCGTTALGGNKTDFIALCNNALTAPGTGITAGYLNGCADAVSSSTSCSITAVAACTTPAGTLPDGTACESDAQCASGDCSNQTSTSGGPSCGTCRATAKEGQACQTPPDNLGCGPGLRCDKNVCVKNVPSPIGGSCTSTLGCVSGSYCVTTPPATTGVCTAYPKKGETCTGTCETGLFCSNGTCADRADVGGACTTSTGCKSNLYCNTTTKVCAAPTIVQAGGACGTSDVKCADGTSCTTTGTNQRTCVAAKQNGQPCSTTDRCAIYLVCVNGTCTPDDPKLCK